MGSTDPKGEGALTTEDDLDNPFTDPIDPKDALTPADIPLELDHGLKKKLRGFAMFAFRAIVDGKLTPREREGLKARLRDLCDELFR